MRYLLLICGTESDFVRPDGTPIMKDCGGWSEEMVRRGVLRGGEGLRPPSDATTLRVRGDEVLISDGPFAETKEQVGGFMIIECADLDEAIEVTSKHPAAKLGSIEIRPLLP